MNILRIGLFSNWIAPERTGLFMEFAGCASVSADEGKLSSSRFLAVHSLYSWESARTTRLFSPLVNGNGGVAAPRGIVKNHALRAFASERAPG